MRYKLNKSNTTPCEWICTDTKFKVVCTWKEGAFNQTQKMIELESTSEVLNNAATIAREMSDWLLANHYHLLFINPRKYIGDRVKELRLKKGYTQQELAIRSGLVQSNIGRVEGGKYNVTLDVLSQLAEALDTKIDLIDK